MKLTVSNFQIHQKPSTLDIPENETTYLEGDSDIGKSALMRAMRWVGENKPDGGSFVTFKQPRGTTSVVTFEADGHTVTRERGKSKNLYKLDDETFEAFGRSVPEPIAKFLNLSPYAFQCQGEVPFLIGASPTEAAKILSDACGLGVIDTAVQFVRQKKTIVEADIRKSEILLESAQGRLATATEQLPLADALETAAGLGDEKDALYTRSILLSDAIDDEPQGEPLDLAGVTRTASQARSAGEMVQLLTGQTLALRRALRDEPAGVLFDISAVVPVAARIHTCACALLEGNSIAAQLKDEIANEPTGILLDVSGAKPFIAEARILGDWIADVTKSAGRIRQAIDSEPVGERLDLLPLANAACAATDLHNTCRLLEKMDSGLRAAINGEPKLPFADTSELLKQRAQIKVCPTCNREL